MIRVAENKFHLKASDFQKEVYLFQELGAEGEPVVITLRDKDTSVTLPSEVYIGFTKNGGNSGAGVEWLIDNGVIKKTTIESTRMRYVSVFPTTQGVLNALNQRFYIYAGKVPESDIYTPPHTTLTPEQIALMRYGEFKEITSV